MKTIATISRIRPDQVGEAGFRDLCGIHPEGDRGRWFECSLPLDDPRFRAIRDRLELAGLRPWADVFRARLPDEYPLEYTREYDPDDFREVSLFEPVPETYCEGLTRDDSGRIEMDVDRLEPEADIATAGGNRLVVSPRLMVAMRQAGLREILFRPTALRDEVQGPIPWDGHGEPFWEIATEFVLPALAPSGTLYHEDGRPFAGDFSRGCYLKDGFHRPAELRYRASDLAGLAGFDLALTREPFGPGQNQDDARRLVASRRFYEFCTDRGLNMGWIPVRVESA
jgi:hypothetical protein